MQEVFDEVAGYRDSCKPVKAGHLERMFRKELSPLVMHPNPDDEFSVPEIGPNMEIIGRYKDIIRNSPPVMGIQFEEPVIVEKMLPKGYMLINGHHRWAAAKQMGLEKINARVVNLIHKSDLNRMSELCRGEKLVSFDLDEVVFAADPSEAEKPLSFFKRRHYTERIRRGVPEVFAAFKEKGFDVWVYTSGYRSEEYLRTLFKAYKAEPDGMINGFGERKSKRQKEIIHSLFDSYKESVHVDLAGVVVSHPGSSDFTQTDIDKNSDWAEQVVGIVKGWRSE